jgi:hypothetical protein
MQSDDVRAHTILWDLQVLEKTRPDRQKEAQFATKWGTSCLDAIRHFLLRVCRRRVYKSLCWYLTESRGSADADRDREVGRDALEKATRATWWEWPGGSTPFFWRWPLYARSVVRDGHPPWFTSDPP